LFYIVEYFWKIKEDLYSNVLEETRLILWQVDIFWLSTLVVSFQHFGIVLLTIFRFTFYEFSIFMLFFAFGLLICVSFQM
jgi:hypothetical protein